MELNKIIGLSILEIRGFDTKAPRKNSKSPECVEAMYILFNDGKTCIELDEQDYYSYHDCSSTARILTVRDSKELWDIIHGDLKRYPVATMDP